MAAIVTETFEDCRYMIRSKKSLLIIVFSSVAACQNSDRLGPSDETQPAAAPEFAVVPPEGIVFASFALTPAQMNTVHTGAVRGMSPSALLSYLSSVRDKKGRVLLNFAGEARNTDGTFSLTKWKSLIDRYKTVNFSSYVSDGTLIGHFLVDEPHFRSRWGGKIIPQATVEAMAKHSKQIWPSMHTIVNAPLSWLAERTVDVPTTYTYLDAGWALFRASTSTSPTQWAANQVTLAKRKGLGVFAGLNVLDGGNGSSGFHGNYPKSWAMSASELRSYGSALLAQSYVCGFAMWKYSSAYYDRADIKSAMGELSSKARNHAKTSCRQ
jgi:hypothetical protein